MLKKFIGSKEFYKSVFFVAFPIIIQKVISNFVNLLDNLMIGQVGSEAMSGVTVAGQLIFVFCLGVFGYTSGAGVLGSQFVGKKDEKGFADTFKIKFSIGIVYILICFVIYIFMGDTLIMSYLHDGNTKLDVALAFQYTKDYLSVMLWGLPFFMVTQIYATSLREMKQTRIPMISGVVAVFVNLVFNYLLIYGHFGFPKLGVVGAALATNISRIVECAICVLWAHCHSNEAVFVKKKNIFAPVSSLTRKMVLVIALPALINEILWSLGQTLLNQNLSLRGVEVVSALAIQSTVYMLFKSIFLALGETIGILIGNALGEGDNQKAIDTDNKIIALSFVLTIVMASIVYLIAPLIPNMYNTIDEVKRIACLLLQLCAISLPIDSLNNAFYNTIKAGGNPVLNFMYDGGYTWLAMVPLAFYIGHFTTIPIIPMYAIIYLTTVILKAIIGFVLVRKRIWVRNLVSTKQ